MNKNISISLAVILIALLLAGPALAGAPQRPAVIKGTLTAIQGNSLTVESRKDGPVTVTLPAGFDASTLAVGDTVMVKGVRQADGTLLASSVRRLGKGAPGDQDEAPGSGDEAGNGNGNGQGKGHGKGQGNGKGHGKPAGEDETAGESEASEASGRANSAFCSGKKQGQPHPLALKLSKKYGVSADWVMGHYCQGDSLGAIMLALKTGQINGADPGSLLAQRAAGQGWGAIWQGLGLIGSEKAVKTPPGQLKKQDGQGD